MSRIEITLNLQIYYFNLLLLYGFHVSVNNTAMLIFYPFGRFNLEMNIATITVSYRLDRSNILFIIKCKCVKSIEAYNKKKCFFYTIKLYNKNSIAYT